MKEETLNDISNKLNVIIWVLLEQNYKDANKGDLIRSLEDFGLSRELISQLTDSSEATVRSSLTPSARAKTKSKSKKKS